jgi:branched-chain amino acid transport system substrate-binding protein
MKWLIGAVGALSLLVAACGSDNNEPSSAQSTAAPNTTAAATSAAAPTSAAASATTAGGSPAAPASGEPIKIGWANADEGNFAFPGMTDGAKVAVDYINKDLGGVDGRPLELVTCSMTPDEASAAKCGQDLANDSSLVAIGSGLNLYGGPFFQATAGKGWKVLGGIPITAADYSAPDAVFFNSGGVGQTGAAAIYVREHFDNVKNVAVVYQDSPGASASVDIVKGHLTPAGIKVTAVPVPQGATDYSVPITAAGAQSADAFMSLTDSPGCVGVAKALQQLAIKAQVMATSSCSDPTVFAAVGDATNGWYFSDGGTNPLLGQGVDPELDTFLGAFAKYGQGKDPAAGFASQAWGSVMSLYEIMKGLGAANVSKDAVGSGLMGFKGPVPVGPRTIACPGKAFASVCSDEGRIFQIQNQKIVNVLDGQPIHVPALQG